MGAKTICLPFPAICQRASREGRNRGKATYRPMIRCSVFAERQAAGRCPVLQKPQPFCLAPCQEPVYTPSCPTPRGHESDVIYRVSTVSYLSRYGCSDHPDIEPALQVGENGLAHPTRWDIVRQRTRRVCDITRTRKMMEDAARQRGSEQVGWTASHSEVHLYTASECIDGMHRLHRQ